MFHTINPEVMLYGTLLFAMWIAVFQAICAGRTMAERTSTALAVTAILAANIALFIFVALKLIDALKAA